MGNGKCKKKKISCSSEEIAKTAISATSLACNGRALDRVTKQKHRPNRQEMSKKCRIIVFSAPPDNFSDIFSTFFGHFVDVPLGRPTVCPLQRLALMEKRYGATKPLSPQISEVLILKSLRTKKVNSKEIRSLPKNFRTIRFTPRISSELRQKPTPPISPLWPLSDKCPGAWGGPLNCQPRRAVSLLRVLRMRGCILDCRAWISRFWGAPIFRPEVPKTFKTSSLGRMD